MRNFRTFKIALVALGLIGGLASAQSIAAKTVKVTVEGTSPMHDWNMNASSGSFSGTVSGNSINNVKFTMPAKNLKSTKGKMMDNKAYATLKADKNANISFTATSVNIGKGNMAGRLTIAGVTKNVSIPVNVVKSGAAYTITAVEKMKLSDYGMERPGFMGVKTGDAITVTVNVVAQ